jgi:hypothetical protein
VGRGHGALVVHRSVEAEAQCIATEAEQIATETEGGLKHLGEADGEQLVQQFGALATASREPLGERSEPGDVGEHERGIKGEGA